MNDGQAALLLLYSIFWGGAVGRFGKYRAFQTSLLWSTRPRQRKRFLYRFMAGMLLLNILPGAWLVLLYFYVVPATTVGEVPMSSIVAGLIAAFSFFAWTRFMHAAVATERTHQRFYTTDEWQQLIDQEGTPEGENPLAVAHWLPGLVYLLLPTSIAYALGRLLVSP